MKKADFLPRIKRSRVVVESGDISTDNGGVEFLRRPAYYELPLPGEVIVLHF